MNKKIQSTVGAPFSPSKAVIKGECFVLDVGVCLFIYYFKL